MKRKMPLTPPQKRELGFVPGSGALVGGGLSASAGNLRGCVVYVTPRRGRGFWYYIVDRAGGYLRGYADVGGEWRYAPLALSRIAGYY